MTGKPPLDERQQTLLRQAKNCRDLAHFLRTDPRVEGHFFIHTYYKGISCQDTEVTFKELEVCGTAACAIGWGILLGITNNLDTPKDFGTDDFGKGWQHLFDPVALLNRTKDARIANRTSKEEALVLEEHATKLEAQI